MLLFFYFKLNARLYFAILQELWGAVWALLKKKQNTPEYNLPVDIVGHRHDHQCPTDPSEDHHSTLVQHDCSLCPSEFQTKKKSSNAVLQGSAVDAHRLPCFSAMIIHRGRLWWWQHVLRPIPMWELSNQQDFKWRREPQWLERRKPLGFRRTCERSLHRRTGVRRWIRRRRYDRFPTDAGRHICRGKSVVRVFPSSNPVDEIRAD